MKNKTSKTLAIIASLAIVSSTFMSLPVYAEDSFFEEIFLDDAATESVDDIELLALNEESASVTDGYSAVQKSAYDKITAACGDFLNSNVSLSTNAFKIVTFDSAISMNDIGTVVSDIKKSGTYPVLNRIGLYSSAGNASYDKITLFTKEEYRTAAGREGIKTIKKPEIKKLEAGNGQVTVTWTAVANAETYRVFTYVDGKYAIAGNTSETTMTVKNLTNGTKYGFLVLSSSDGKTYSKFTTSDIKYATPAALAAKPEITDLTPEDGQVTVTWTAAANAETYRVFTYVDGKYAIAGNTSETTMTVKNLTNGTNYGFLVLSSSDGKTYSRFTTNDIKYATPKI